MKVLIDDCIPYIRGLLEPVAEVGYLAPDSFTREAVANADALIIRTRQHCDSALLEGSRVRLIATATIGQDHIDIPWCTAHGITVANAPGCNAPAVAQYVLAAIYNALGDSAVGRTIGVVGVGHVGSIVARWARSAGLKVMLCDPPRARREGSEGFHSLAEIARHADIITFHTPLTRSGIDATYHLADEAFLSSLRRTPLIINAARGGIIDEQALLHSDHVGPVVIDCWEGEPRINTRMLEGALIATPHIAGYSVEGKLRATQMSLDALTRTFGLPHISVREPMPAPTPDTATLDAVASSYPIMADDSALRAHPEAFEALRNSYTLRKEFNVF